MKYILIYIIKIYKLLISPLFPNSCRFYPTCSSYAVESLHKHGFFRGSWLSAKRIVKCNPFHPGGFDPVPEIGFHKHIISGFDGLKISGFNKHQESDLDKHQESDFDKDNTKDYNKDNIKIHNRDYNKEDYNKYKVSKHQVPKNTEAER